MIEKPVPWWRKALNYALSGIRSGFGLFSKLPKPASPETSPLEEDRFQNNSEPTLEPEPIQDPEQILEVEEPLIDRPANPETVESVAQSVIEPVEASEIEPVPAAPAESVPVSDPLPASTSEIAPLVEIVSANETAPSGALNLQPASQPAEELDPEGGGGFNPRIKPTELARALAPETPPEPIVDPAPVDEPAPAIDSDSSPSLGEVGSTPEPPIEHESAPVIEPVPEPEPVAESFAEPNAELAATPNQPTVPAVDPESPIEPDFPTEPLPEPTSPPIVDPVSEAASIPEPIAQEAEAEPAPVTEPAPEPAQPAPSAVEPAAQPPAQPAPGPIADEKAAAKLAARQKRLDDAAELSPFSVIVGQVYTGPLDLLLDLIRQQDIDIYDIPIAKITAQFLAYVNQLKATDVDVAGEFIYIASLLIHIKSKMLLPRSPAGPGETPEDPRRELVERLLEHERFKNAAQMLQQKQMLEAATWTNPGFREFQDDDAAEPEIAADTVDLVRIFRDILERARNRPVIDLQEDSVTVGQMIQFLARRLTLEDKPIALRRLLSHTRSERALVAMFLALLELVRLQAVLLRQDRAFSDIFIKKHTGFDAVMNQGLANALDDWR
jgi:segregation and condensation protein A